MQIKRHVIILIMALAVMIATSCSKVTGDLADQAPMLVVNIKIINDPTNIIQISNTNKVYLVYYSNNDWSNPWLEQGSNSATILNPAVAQLSFYLMAFWDADGNGVVDPGEPCTGYMDKTHSGAPEELTKLELLPLIIRPLIISLDPARVY